MKKYLLVFTALCLVAGRATAQADEATQARISANADLIAAVVNICYLLGAICGLIGAVLAYTKIIDGQASAFTLIRNWFFACITLLLMPALVRGLMGV